MENKINKTMIVGILVAALSLMMAYFYKFNNDYKILFLLLIILFIILLVIRCYIFYKNEDKDIKSILVIILHTFLAIGLIFNYITI